jgi:hypothetical protein
LYILELLTIRIAGVFFAAVLMRLLAFSRLYRILDLSSFIKFAAINSLHTPSGFKVPDMPLHEISLIGLLVDRLSGYKIWIYPIFAK